MTEHDQLLVGLEELKRKVKKTEKKLNYAKNKESKLLCLIYNLQSKGVPVNEVYNAEVKDIPTSRFGELAEEDKQKKLMEGGMND
jgi:seryl-tRNA synthetase